MLTSFVYLFNGLVLIYFSWKVFRSIQKKNNPFMVYFLGVSSFFSLSMLVYFVLLTWYMVFGTANLLFWSDFWGRIPLYIGSVFAVQTPLYTFFPKSKSRFLASAAIFLAGLSLVFYNLSHQNQPYIDSLGIIHWQADNIISWGLALIFLGVWVPTSAVFIYQFIKSKFSSKKSFFLGLGFFLGSFSAAMQDFARTTIEYLVINLLLAVGFVLILTGLFYEERK